MDLAAHLAYYGIADPKLLGVQSAHSKIADYADITQYLTPQGISFLHTYIADQTTNSQDSSHVAYLALTSLNHLPARGTALLDNPHGLHFDKPFRVAHYAEIIDPHVTLAADDVTMLVTGSCSVSILGHRDGKPVYIVFRRTSFTYAVQPTPSTAYPVGVSGWNSINKSTVTPR